MLRDLQAAPRRVLAFTLAIVAGGCGAAAPAAVPSSALGASGAPADTPQNVCPAASFDELARQLRDYYCDTAEGSIASSEIESCDDIRVTLDAPTGGGEGLDARLLQLATPTGQVFVLMVCTRDHTAAFFLDDLWDQTDEEATTSSEGTVRRLERVDLVPGSASELRLDVAFSRSRGAWHGCTRESVRHERTILCEAAPSGPRCADLPTLTNVHAECDRLCLVRQLTNDDASCEDEGVSSHEREVRLAVEVQDGRVRVTESSAVDLAAPAGLVGDHTLEELLVMCPLEPLMVAD